MLLLFRVCAKKLNIIDYRSKYLDSRFTNRERNERSKSYNCRRLNNLKCNYNS